MSIRSGLVIFPNSQVLDAQFLFLLRLATCSTFLPFLRILPLFCSKNFFEFLVNPKTLEFVFNLC